MLAEWHYVVESTLFLMVDGAGDNFVAACECDGSQLAPSVEHSGDELHIVGHEAVNQLQLNHTTAEPGQLYQRVF